MARLIKLIFLSYTLMLVYRVLGSWVPELREHPSMRFVAQYTDPYLDLFRSIVPSIGSIDISPVLAFLALNFAEAILLVFFR